MCGGRNRLPKLSSPIPYLKVNKIIFREFSKNSAVTKRMLIWTSRLQLSAKHSRDIHFLPTELPILGRLATARQHRERTVMAMPHSKIPSSVTLPTITVHPKWRFMGRYAA